MCGIVGYVGNSQACSILLNGLKKLEYRGYDSAGMAVIHDGRIQLTRVTGKVRALESSLVSEPIPGWLGVGHTRWATHGRPSTENAHPHLSGKVAVVHNGIIENYLELKEHLISSGRCFLSETDTEVIAQLIDYYLDGGLPTTDAIRQACNQLRGSFAVGILVEDDPETLYAVRKESPLIIGLAQDEAFLASDIPPILGHTRQVIYMDDGEIAILRKNGVSFMDFRGDSAEKIVNEVSMNLMLAEKGGYKHYMLKEIFEQPRAVADSFRGRIAPDLSKVILDELKLSDEEIKNLEKILIVACGTSYHAGLVGRRIIEDLNRIPVEVEIASEFRYRDPIIGPKTLLIAISQSGETADTLAAAREAVKRGASLISICNVVESSLARMSHHGVIYTHAGPEIGVASTKAFTTQITILYLLGLYIAQKRSSLSAERQARLLDELTKLPQLMEMALAEWGKIQDLARQFECYSNFLYLGRGINTPIAYEGALKLKEISYIHAEAYAGGEMKHGPIALINEQMPVVITLSKNDVYEKMLGNMEEVRSRGGRLLVFYAGPDDPKLEQMNESFVRVPMSNDYLTGILLTLLMQLFAYYVADFKGTDIDQPRNLAKSVTVE